MVLAKGYMVHELGEEAEQLFAVYPNGVIVTSGIRKYDSINFHTEGEKWVVVDSLPEDAEFIGNYEMKELMTKERAKHFLACLSSGTLATLTGITSYDRLDEKLEELLDRIDYVDVSNCRNWQDVWELVK